MISIKPNPFKNISQPRDHLLTFRMTEAEYQAVRAIVGNKRGAIVGLIREGLALALDARATRRRK